jgi:hypothetical protein
LTTDFIIGFAFITFSIKGMTEIVVRLPNAEGGPDSNGESLLVEASLGHIAMPEEVKETYYVANPSSLESSPAWENQLMIPQTAYHGINATKFN